MGARLYDGRFIIRRAGVVSRAGNKRRNLTFNMMTAGPISVMSNPAAPDTGQPVVESDEALVQRLRRGDAAAGDELVTRHCRPLLRYLQRLTGADHLAEEMHQQTWLSVLDHLDRFNPSASGGGFKAWLYRIATNKANDYWRSQGRESAAKKGLKLIVEQTAPEAGRRMEDAEQVMKLRRAIERLPENQKQVLLLRYYSNLKFTQIAAALGCPLNTALGRMHKAMLKLRQLMDE
jgi:RNA polymerase sigma-70 factor (ECF subfamily)